MIDKIDAAINLSAIEWTNHFKDMILREYDMSKKDGDSCVYGLNGCGLAYSINMAWISFVIRN